MPPLRPRSSAEHRVADDRRVGPDAHVVGDVHEAVDARPRSDYRISECSAGDRRVRPDLGSVLDHDTAKVREALQRARRVALVAVAVGANHGPGMDRHVRPDAHSRIQVHPGVKHRARADRGVIRDRAERPDRDLLADTRTGRDDSARMYPRLRDTSDEEAAQHSDEIQPRRLAAHDGCRQRSRSYRLEDRRIHDHHGGSACAQTLLRVGQIAAAEAEVRVAGVVE